MNRWLLTLLMLVAVLPTEAQEFHQPDIGGLLHPRISPGTWEVAASYQGAIVVMPYQGGTAKRLTTADSWDIEPAWSPDGETIAYWETTNFVAGQLRLIDAKTGEQQELPKTIRGSGRLWYSTDGKRIFGILGDGQFPVRPSWLDLETGEVTVLPIGPEDSAAFSRKRMKLGVVPGSDDIIYAIHRDEPNEQGGNRSPKSDVWRCRADGGEAVQLFTWPARIYDVVPRPKRESMVIVSDLGQSHNDLWEIPLGVGPKEMMAGAKCLSATFADDERPSFDESGYVLMWSDNAEGTTRLWREYMGKYKDTPVPEVPKLNQVPFTGVTFGDSLGLLTVAIEDPEAGYENGVTARVSVKQVGGKFFSPAGKLYRLTGNIGHFYARGTCEIEVPAGEYEVKVFRGLEYRVYTEKVTVDNGEDVVVQAQLDSWSNQDAEDWYSGENHVHANYGYGEWYNRPESILLQAEGEGLNVCNTVVANSDGDAIFDREFFYGQLDPRSTDRHLLYCGEEFRSTIWGHMTLSSLSQLVEPIMTGFPGTTNPWDVPTNADIALATIEQGGTIGYTHPAGNRLDLYDQPYSAKGLPVDAALGRIKLMDVHGHTYDGASQLWYKLMNCGLKVVGSSGTDVFLNRLRSYPPGWARTYVHLPDGLDYDAWVEGQNAGRSFFTNGPMLRFTVNGKMPGDELELDAPGKVSVKASMASQVPLDTVEVVHNGEVVQSLELSEDKLSATFEGEVEVTASGWLALRARGPAHVEIIRDPTAHTNPVWVVVPGVQNTRAKEDAAYFLKWIDRLEASLKERNRMPSDRAWEHVRGQLDGARDFYKKVMGG